jgi:hypothetical protein
LQREIILYARINSSIPATFLTLQQFPLAKMALGESIMSPKGNIINGVGAIRETRIEIEISKMVATMEKIETLALLQIILETVIDMEEQVQKSPGQTTIVEEAREKFPEAEIVPRIDTIEETIAGIVGKIGEIEAIAKVQWTAESAEIPEIIHPDPSTLTITHIINLTGNVQGRALIFGMVIVLGETTADSRMMTKLTWQLNPKQTNSRKNGCNPLLCKWIVGQLNL